jgi:hypothetical protein
VIGGFGRDSTEVSVCATKISTIYSVVKEQSALVKRADDTWSSLLRCQVAERGSTGHSFSVGPACPFSILFEESNMSSAIKSEDRT